MVNTERLNSLLVPFMFLTLPSGWKFQFFIWPVGKIIDHFLLPGYFDFPLEDHPQQCYSGSSKARITMSLVITCVYSARRCSWLQRTSWKHFWWILDLTVKVANEQTKRSWLKHWRSPGGHSATPTHTAGTAAMSNSYNSKYQGHSSHTFPIPSITAC